MVIRLNEELMIASDKTIDGRGATVHINRHCRPYYTYLEQPHDKSHLGDAVRVTDSLLLIFFQGGDKEGLHNRRPVDAMDMEITK
ncbi:hypothetical protein MKW98_022892 [Papaver atlanticum]|uniref:Uncharacterized protein n=1 Tax=Papaver atlanticum TaxID=357466 RepID=A0AAD4TNQ0_9MAGN|nr:hypothetical protein MKW98_022892 [Papaver atlanticum]